MLIMSVFRELSSTITLTLQLTMKYDPPRGKFIPLDAGLELGVTTDRSKTQCDDTDVNPRTYYL